MAAPTEGQNIKKSLANGEPSTHGAKRTSPVLIDWRRVLRQRRFKNWWYFRWYLRRLLAATLFPWLALSA
jgi:hypothetical protein